MYFSALEGMDAGNYSCNVQSKISNTGKNGPLFSLQVVTHCVYYSSLIELINLMCLVIHILVSYYS